jgi:hypothetical protein
MFTLLLALLLQQPSGVPSPQRVWEARLPSRAFSLSVAPSGFCTAVLLQASAEVRSETGQRVWASPVSVDPQDAAWSRIVISPQCDWTATSINRNGRPPILHIFGKDGSRHTYTLDGMLGLEPNGTNVSSLAISPDGKLLAVGFEGGRLWIVGRNGVLQGALGPFSAPQIDATFTPDSKRLIIKGWLATGLMDFDGSWVWKSSARNLAASNNLSLFATLTAPMHGPQVGEVSIVDTQGRTAWSETAWNARMAIAPDGSFVAISTTFAKSQHRAPSTVPELMDGPDVWLRDRTGKVLAHRPFKGNVAGVSSDSKCVVLQTESDVVGVNRELKEVWRMRNAKSPQIEGNLILENWGNSLRASRMPACK